MVFNLYCWFQDEITYVSLATPDVRNILYLSESGAVYLVENLYDITTLSTYTFRVQALDNRKTNPQNAEATVRVTVVPLAGPPQFQTSYVEVEIPITQEINSTFYSVSARDPDQRVS